MEAGKDHPGIWEFLPETPGTHTPFPSVWTMQSLRPRGPGAFPRSKKPGLPLDPFGKEASVGGGHGARCPPLRLGGRRSARRDFCSQQGPRASQAPHPPSPFPSPCNELGCDAPPWAEGPALAHPKCHLANPQGQDPARARTFLLLLSDDLSPLGPFVVRGDEEGVALREKQQVATQRNLAWF